MPGTTPRARSSAVRPDWPSDDALDPIFVASAPEIAGELRALLIEVRADDMP